MNGSTSSCRNRIESAHDVAMKAHVTMLACLLLLMTGCAGAPAFSPTPNLYADSPKDPFASVPAELRTNTATMLYATDRQAKTTEKSFAYGTSRSRALAYGLCTVTIGEDISWEDLAAASRTRKRASKLGIALTNIDERGYFPELDAPVQIDGRWQDSPTYLQGTAEATEEVHKMLAEQLAKTPCKEVFVFVHGYNNTFAEATYRIAEIWHFIGREGVPVVYSWPAGSSGLLRGYTRDRESGEFSNAHLKQFIRTLASCPEVKKINLIAHSRGNDVLTTALKELHIECRAAGRDTRADLKLGQVILAAPDIDLDVCIERFSSERLGFVPERLTIYVSPNDKALELSTWLFGSIRRLGQVSESDLEKNLAQALRHHPIISVVDVRAKSDFLGHGYITSNPAVLSDLILVLRDHKAPGTDNGRPLVNEGGFWQLLDGYPNNNVEVESKP